jgi:hypothetical protein
MPNYSNYPFYYGERFRMSDQMFWEVWTSLRAGEFDAPGVLNKAIDLDSKTYGSLVSIGGVSMSGQLEALPPKVSKTHQSSMQFTRNIC